MVPTDTDIPVVASTQPFLENAENLPTLDASRRAPGTHAFCDRTRQKLLARDNGYHAGPSAQPFQANVGPLKCAALVTATNLQ